MAKTWKRRVNPDARLVDVPIELEGPSGRTTQARFVLDPGTPVTIFDARLAPSIDLGDDRSEGPSKLWSATGPDDGYKVRVKRLSVMGYTLTDQLIRCHHLWREAGIDGLVGLDVIRRGKLVLDLPWGLVEFTWN